MSRVYLNIFYLNMNNSRKSFFSRSLHRIKYVRKYRNFERTNFLLILERSFYNHVFAMVGVFFTACIHVGWRTKVVLRLGTASKRYVVNSTWQRRNV